ncbi:HIT domain-containing protein [Phenylobacterium sp.]|uniref:HIT domain-containing protein n=1 Tax=Phenylobacterium sp. TaxID=1871053 RepID=UPI00301E08C8
MPHPLAAMFDLHPAFPATSESVGDLALCHVRLHGDARWPWLVLLPRVAGATELEHLSGAERGRLVEEVVQAGTAVRAVGEALGLPVAKLNVGQLGNITPQLHVHVIGRWAGDPAWPGPVWGHGTAAAFDADGLERALAAARASLAL